MINKKSFGSFVREKRMEKGLTQKELAELLYISESAVSKWEMAKSYPDITLIPDLCRVLEVSEHELIEGAVDTEAREMKKEARAYRRLSEGFFKGFTIAYLAAFVICVICDLAVNHRLSFSIIVFGAFLVAYSFVPTWIRFTKKHKLLMFVGTTYASMLVLFLICCIYYRQNWFGNAALGVLLGYICLFGPLLLRRYLPETKRKYTLLIVFAAAYACLVLLLLVVRITHPYSLGQGLMISLYSFLPFLIIALVHLLPIRASFRAAVDVAAGAVLFYGMPWFLERIAGVSTDVNYYQADFSDWLHHINGNISLICLLGLAAVAILLVIIGLIRRRSV